MSWFPRHGRIIRSAADEGEVFVLGQGVRRELATSSPVADALGIVAAAEERRLALADRAESELAAARAEAAGVRETAYREGLARGRAAGREEVGRELEGYLDLLRAAAAEGKGVRDAVAAESTALIARAAMIVARRIIAAHFEAAPGATAAACAEAVRAAAGQAILSIRVNPAVAGEVRASLVDHADYVAADGAVAIGGCLIDLRDGVIDATLDARLELMEVALGRATGEPAL